ncbi:MAG TPA: alpha/beta fold hydrolase [Candidatus Saccharimonadales bacterium]|nr:alpha/beta fold hydrolase [Candidatus Saccharimonadales bacterium]
MDRLCYQDHEEETVFFDLPGVKGLKIKGILRGGLDMPLVVMVHGRPGSGNELLPYLAARFLYEKGYSSLRLFMYDFEPNTRNLLDCTLDTHVDDFDAVISELRKRKIPKIFAVGHSYGGITILRSRAKLDGAVLWDPTHGLVFREPHDENKKYPEKTIGNMVIGTAGPGYINGSVAANKLDEQMGDTTRWAADKGYPLKIIAAGKGVMTHLGKKYFEAADEPKEYVVIDEAHHQFEDSDAVVFRLFEETLGWIDKY